MKKSKKVFTLAVIYIIAALLTLGGLVYTAGLRQRAAERRLTLNYSHAFADLSVCMGKMSENLEKMLYSASPPMISTLCAETYSYAASAAMLTGLLPYSNVELEKTAAFIEKTGDFIHYMLRTTAAGNVRTDDESQNLTSLSENAAHLAEQLSAMQASVLSGEFTLEKMDTLREDLSEKDAATSLVSEFARLEGEFPEMPELKYDGRLSAGISDMPAKLIEGNEDVSEDDALNIAAEFSGLNAGTFSVEHVLDGITPVYVIVGETPDGWVSFDITRQGGVVLGFDDSRPVGNAVLSEDEGASIAKAFLENHGFKSMSSIGRESSGSEMTALFAYSQDGVVCLPDAVKVTVALDSGDITGFDATEYVANHQERTFPAPTVSQEVASSALSPALSVIGAGDAVIPTEGKREIYCHEFKCRTPGGTECLVYVNAATGAEEKIVLKSAGTRP